MRFWNNFLRVRSQIGLERQIIYNLWEEVNKGPQCEGQNLLPLHMHEEN